MSGGLRSGGRWWRDAPARASVRETPPPRFLATVLVLTSVITAGVGFLLNYANAQGSSAAGSAQQLAQQASGSFRTAYDTALSDYFTYLTHETDSDAEAVAEWNTLIDSQSQQEWLDTESVDAAEAAASGAQVTPALAAGADSGPQLDPSFPRRFFTSRTHAATTQQAASGQYSTIAGEWGALSGAYTVALTMLGIALFLFGTATQLLGRNRMLFALVGCGLVLGSAAWSGVVTLGRPQPYSAQAADAYAAGVDASSLAILPQDASTAITQLTRSIDARPDDGEAYAQRADAEVIRGGGENAGVVATVEQPFLDDAASDFERAYTLGVHTADVLTGVAFTQYDQWLAHPANALPQRVVDLSTQLLELDGTYAPNEFGDALFRLGADDQGGAAASFTAGVRMLVSAPASGIWPFIERGMVAGVLASLDVLGTSAAPASHPGMAAMIDRFRGELTASVASGEVASASSDPAVTSLSVQPSQVSVTHDAAHLSLAFTPPAGWNGADPAHDLSRQHPLVAWFTRDSVSGQWINAGAGIVWDPALTPLRFDSATGKYESVVSNVALNGTCLLPGQYRADVYIDGHRILSVAEAASAQTTQALVARLRPEMQVIACVPPGWRFRQSTAPGAAFTAVLTSPDGTEGAVMMRIAQPALYNDAQDNGTLVSSLQNGIHQSLATSFATSVFGLPAPFGAQLQQTNAGSAAPFAGLSGGGTVSGVLFAAGSQVVAVGGGWQPDGSQIMCAVFGPRSAAAASGAPSLLQQIYASFQATS